MDSNFLRSFWIDKIRINWKLGLFLILTIGLLRFYLVMEANMAANYSRVSIVFMLMTLLPVILLNHQGLLRIGLGKPLKKRWIAYSAILGMGFCFITYFIGTQLFGHEISNWFVYISKSYAIERSTIAEDQYLIYFLIYASVSMIFSPIGEEIFYRGLVHQCFQEKYGSNRASQIDSAAFAFTHLAHFGFIFHEGHWQFLFIPATLWVLLMFMASRIFFICKLQSGSLLGPIVSHAAFNLTMLYLIFFHIL